MPNHPPHKGVKRTKENFKTALLSLMEQKRFNDITITEIVNYAKYNRGTFYAHYQKKEDLLDEIIEEMFSQMIDAYRQPYLNLSVLDFNKLPPKSIILFDHFLENHKFYKLMLSPATNYDFREKMVKRLDQLFRDEFEFIITDIDPEIDINLFSTYRIQGIIGLILEWIDNDFRQSSSYMGDQLLRILRFFTPKIYIKTRT